MKHVLNNVPRYYEPYVNDCFATAYGACLAHQGHNTQLVLADYLSFMFDEETGYIGTTYMYRYSTSVEFTESELNSSLAFIYFPKTTEFQGDTEKTISVKYQDRIQISMFIHDDPEVAAARVKALIDAGKPVAIVVDLHYMSYHKAFMNDHGLHAMVVVGYDEENGTYDVFDKYALSSSDYDGTLPMSAIREGRLSDTPRQNHLIGEYRRPIRNLWMEFDTGTDFQITQAKLLAVIEESYARMSGTHPLYPGESGLQRIEAFMESLRLRKEEPLDEAKVNLFKEYYNTSLKRVARGRRRFRVFIEEIADMLPRNIVDALSEQLQLSEKRWDICANTALKLAISKAPRLFDDLERNLQIILEIEGGIVELLRECHQSFTVKES
ncbi:BtrH N-terminal domain-containing protein [Paenibacillus sp. SI8]|uniref:BtrH N-terminal domain-containing protein n=1 Tax=unclassified Paenibacillus TaxID=185978 RepID=UPI003465BD2B